jgi:hypothetical protein
VQGVWAAVNAGSTSLTNPISGDEDFDPRDRSGAKSSHPEVWLDKK